MDTIGVARACGVWHRRQLDELGWDARRLRAALAGGQLVRLRSGWFAEPGADAAVVRAVGAGGVLGCSSALAFHGVWVVPSPAVHVRLDRNRQLGGGRGLLSCPPCGGREPSPRVAVDPVELAVRSAWRCLPAESFVVAADSLWNLGIATPDEVLATVGNQPGAAKVLARCDRAESGTESLVRLRLRRRGIGVRTQVVIGDVGRVDLLVGERLVIEVDSRAHHTGQERYQSDRWRDLRLTSRGYLVVRVTWEQVMYSWAETEAHILALVREGQHRLPGHR